MGLFSRGAAWLADRQVATEGVTVSYRRGGTTVSVAAVVGDQNASAVSRAQQGQAVVISTGRDYLIVAASLATAGIAGVPVLGDRITQTISGVATLFEVSRGPGSESCWEWSEPERVTYRVHTKRVA